MRLFIIVVLVFFTNAYSVTAQNFQPFQNKYKYQFTYTGYIKNDINSELIHGIEVDSANLVGSDSVFYFNRLSIHSNIQDSYDNFWGTSMIKKTNGEYLFLIKGFNQTDTVIIKTQETLGAQWTFKLQNALYTIKYKSYKQETVLTNQTDYVKTFIVENNSGFEDSIKISENFGLIYSFPFLGNSLHHNHFNLTYILNTKIGANKLNYFDYFHYDAGDILTYEPNAVYPNPHPIGNEVYKVLSKTTSLDDDTVTYSFSICHIDAFNGNIYSTTQTHCTLIITECSVTGNFPYTYPLSFPPNKYGDFYAFATNLYDNQILFIAPTDVFEAPFSEYTFQIDIGLARYDYNGGIDQFLPNTYYSNTGYIKQSNIDDDCSNLETILDTKSSHATSSNLVIAPNPFDQSISLNATDLNPGNWNIRIVSALGVEVYASTIVISSSNQQIDLSNVATLTAGIYFLSLENESQVYSQKIVKK